MGTVSTTLPSDGQTIDASDVNTPINAILAEFNGNIDNDNIKTGANISGSKLGAATTPLSVLDTDGKAGWITGVLAAPNTITNNGNRSYDVVFNGVDYTDELSEGMRLRLTRTVSAPTQCADLESGSSNYFNKTSPNKCTFTDDFNAGAWVKLESYTVATQTIISRYNGTSGWAFYILSSGQVALYGYNGGSGNVSNVVSYQAIPLGKWVHVSAQLDMSAFTATSTTSFIMIDGVDVPASVSRSGTNPTALVQAGNLEVGGQNGGLLPFDGKLTQVFYTTAKVTQATLRTYMSQGISGSETSLGSAYSFSNSITDLNTTTPNDLTAQNSAVATNVDSPFGNYLGGTYEYAVISAKPTFSTNTTVTVQVPEGCAIPTSGGVSAVAYSTQSSPYGMPVVSPIIGYAQINADFAGTTNAGNGDNVLGLTATVTVTTGKDIRFIVTGKSVKSSGAAGGTTSVRVVEGTTEVAGFTAQIPVAGYNTNPNFTSPPIRATAGSHTYQVNIVQSAAGTQTFAATTTAPGSLSVEVVGGL